jgi:hypothetical protein
LCDDSRIECALLRLQHGTIQADSLWEISWATFRTPIPFNFRSLTITAKKTNPMRIYGHFSFAKHK